MKGFIDNVRVTVGKARYGKKRWRIDWRNLFWILLTSYVGTVLMWRVWGGEWVFW